MEQFKRLSIEDFKLSASGNRSEIEKMMGGVAAGCHVTTCTAWGHTFTDDDCNGPTIIQ